MVRMSELLSSSRMISLSGSGVSEESGTSERWMTLGESLSMSVNEERRGSGLNDYSSAMGRDVSIYWRLQVHEHTYVSN